MEFFSSQSKIKTEQNLNLVLLNKAVFVGTIISLVLGCLAGVVTGIIPGLHINTVAAVFTKTKPEIEPLLLSVFLTALSVSHNFFDFIPATILGIPDEGNVLAIHPSKKYLMKGKARRVLRLLSLGCLSAILIGTIIFPLIIVTTPLVYKRIRPFIGVFLFGISLHLLLIEKKPKKAAIIFILSGLVGMLVLRPYELLSLGGLKWAFLTNMQIEQPLLPLLTGLFGLSDVIKGIRKNLKIPKQTKMFGIDIEKKHIVEGGILGILASLLMSFLPAIGPTQASLVTEEIKKKKEDVFFLSLGAVNTSDILVSTLALYTISKPRSGALVFIKEILKLDKMFLFILLSTIFVSAIISFYLFRKISEFILDKISEVNYSNICITMLIFILTLVFVICGPVGLFVLFLSSLIGHLCSKFNVRKTNLMGALVIPTLTYYI